jgi:hypothetical protein
VDIEEAVFGTLVKIQGWVASYICLILFTEAGLLDALGNSLPQQRRCSFPNDVMLAGFDIKDAFAIIVSLDSFDILHSFLSC